MRLFAFMLVLLLGHTLSSQTPPSSIETAWDGAKSSAKLEQIEGQVFIAAEAAKNNQPLFEGTEIRTEAGSTGVISFSEGSKAKLSEKGKFRLDQLSPTKISIFVTLGTVHCWVSKLPGRDFEVRTPTSVSNVIGTEFTVTVDASGKTTLKVISGSVEIKDALGNKITLGEGKSMTTDKAGDPSIAKIVLAKAIAELKKQLGLATSGSAEYQRIQDGLNTLNKLAARLDTTGNQKLIDAIHNRANDILKNLGPSFSDQDLINLNNLVDLSALEKPSSTAKGNPSLANSAAAALDKPVKPPGDPPVIKAPQATCISCGPGQQCIVNCETCTVNPDTTVGGFLCNQ